MHLGNTVHDRRPPGRQGLKDLSDEVLVDAVDRHADGDAFAELHRRHSASVARATKRIVSNEVACNEVVADVFIDLWYAPEKFDPVRGTLRAFLRVKARCLGIDLLRSDASRWRRESTYVRGSPVYPEIGSEVLTREASIVLRDAIESLSPSERESIYLAFFVGMSYRAVAVRLEMPEGTVKARIRSGLRRLRSDPAIKRYVTEWDL
jgi:RNA polymerase sigma-70 factor (ECF subfamily)